MLKLQLYKLLFKKYGRLPLRNSFFYLFIISYKAREIYLKKFAIKFLTQHRLTVAYLIDNQRKTKVNQL